jgi:hypothetical protein
MYVKCPYAKLGEICFFFFLRLQKVLSNTKKNGEEMILAIAILYV